MEDAVNAAKFLAELVKTGAQPIAVLALVALALLWRENRRLAERLETVYRESIDQLRGELKVVKDTDTAVMREMSSLMSLVRHQATQPLPPPSPEPMRRS
jgi:hypothetical protein